MITKQKWFPVFYMFVVTAFFSSFVIGFTAFTGERVKANETLAFEKAMLAVLPGLYDENEKISGLQLHRRFEEKVSPSDEYSGGAYTLKQSGKIIAYALPISGQGFWAPIKGFIGIEADRKTITGISIYQQNETPGLGAEISKPEFRNQFKGKVVLIGDKPLNIARPGTKLDQSSVHAVTGATQTSTRLEIIINNALNQWQQSMLQVKQ
ncbi:MAG: FMN-binding protein [Sedimentisphaerales bacterium]|nr:FMN-binding protein [Sedimentisphaerales bacterium]